MILPALGSFWMRSRIFYVTRLFLFVPLMLLSTAPVKMDDYDPYLFKPPAVVVLGLFCEARPLPDRTK